MGTVHDGLSSCPAKAGQEASDSVPPRVCSSDVKTGAKTYPQGTLLISKLNACFCPCFPAVLDCYYYNIKRQRCKNILSPKIVRIRLSNIAIYER